MRISSSLLLVLLIVGTPAGAQTPDGPACIWGADISFPHCEASFADEVVVKTPSEITVEGQSLENVKGHPDGKSLTLGCGGMVIVKFTDNALVDIAKNDLHVFEKGEDHEATNLEISTDGENWIDLGGIPGAKASIEISGFVDPGQIFTYVKLTDLRQACDGIYKGAEIDAVGAIGAAIREKFDSDVLFDYDSALLRPSGVAALTVFAQTYVSEEISRIIINGHASSEGAEAYNLDLSRRRAAAVRTYLSGRPEFETTRILSNGLGESQADQTSAREEDRRVDAWLVKNNP